MDYQIKNLKLGELTFGLEVVKQHPTEGLKGSIDHQSLKIVIQKQSDAAMIETILHEIIHAIYHFSQIKGCEKDVTRLTHWLLAVLKDNPEFVGVIGSI